MQIYIIIFPIILFFYILTMNFFVNNKKNFVVLSFGFLGIISVLRANTVGTDVYSYQQIFLSNIQGGNLGDLQTKSIGYYLFSRTVGMISKNPQAITIACSILVSLLIGIFIYRNSEHVLFSTLLFVSMYFFADSLNGTRQFIAILLVLNAHYLLISGKKIRALVILGIALSFHLTAIIGVFIFFVDKICWNLKRLSFLSIILISIAGSYTWIFNWFTNHISSYSLYASFNDGTSEKGKLIFIFLFFLVSILAIVLLDHKGKISLSRNEYSVLVIYYTGVLFSIIFFYNTFMFQLLRRLLLYFNIFGILYFPIFCIKISSLTKKPKIVSGIIFIILFGISLYTYFTSLNSNMNGIVPYIPFF